MGYTSGEYFSSSGSSNYAGGPVSGSTQFEPARSKLLSDCAHQLFGKPQGKKKYECNVCGATFGTHGGRYYHMASHTGKFKYKCDLCDKGFMKTDAYRNHIATHRKQIQGR